MTLFIVHGFGYDPLDIDGVANPVPFFEEIRQATNRPDAIGFPWYSVPPNVRGFVSTWLRFPPYLHRYRHAWARTDIVAHELAAKIKTAITPVDLIGHSLGTRVICKALRLVGANDVKRVLFLNGAELQKDAIKTVQCSNADVLNVAVKTDDVLGVLGSHFVPGRGACLGQAGSGFEILQHYNWRDIFLDNKLMKAQALLLRDWTLNGDNPKSVEDHWYSFRNPQNWPLLQAWASGDDLIDIAPRRKLFKLPPPI